MIKYRCNNVSAGEFSPVEAISFEMSELLNTDVIDFLLKHQHDKKYRLSSTVINALKDICDKLDNETAITVLGESDKVLNDKRLDVDDDIYIESTVAKIITELEKNNGMRYSRCLWLCDTEVDVKEQYCTDKNDKITACEVETNTTLIVSDLGCEGKLYLGCETSFKERKGD